MCAAVRQYRLVGGKDPHNGEVVISMLRMDKIAMYVDPASNTMDPRRGSAWCADSATASSRHRPAFPALAGRRRELPIAAISHQCRGTTALAIALARREALGLGWCSQTGAYECDAK